MQDTLTGYGNAHQHLGEGRARRTTVDAAQAEVDDDPRRPPRTSPRADPDFSIFNPSSILAAVTSTTSTFTLLLGAVAAISLLVGGIGVMNIMLVTVTERTREIGIRKAIGAQRGDIVGQFLLEAVLLSMFGGLIGVVIGVVGRQLQVRRRSSWSWRRTRSCWPSASSVAIGLFFGIFPANRAASLRPIDALRYE